MFFLMVIRSFTRGWKRKLLAAVTIALGASLAAAMLSIALDVGDKVARELRTYGANLAVKPKTVKALSDGVNLDYDPLSASSFLNEEDLKKIKLIFWRNNIVAFAPFLYGRGETGPEKLSLVGTWFDKKLVLETGQTVKTGISKTKPWLKIKGAWPSDDPQAAQALVGRKAAKKLDLKPGDRLKIDTAGKPFDVKVAGVMTSGDELDEHIFLPLGLLQRNTGLAGKISEAEVSALTTPENELGKKYQKDPESLSSAEWEKWYCTPYVDAIAFQIEEVMRGSTAKPVRRVAQSEGLVLGKIQLLMLLLAAAALVSTALAISSLMTAIVLERSREVGLAKALGAADWLVVLIFLAEAALLGLIGGGAGYGIGIAFAQAVGRAVFGSAVSLKSLVLPLTLFVSLLVTLGGSLAAIRTIMRLSPKEVLHG